MGGNKLTVGEMVYKISGDMKNLKTELRKAEAEVRELERMAGKTDSTFKNWGKNLAGVFKVGIGTAVAGITALGYGIQRAARESWNQVDAVEQATVALKAYEKDADKVTQVLEELVDYARSPLGVLFQRQELFGAAQALKTMGAETENLTKYVEIMSRSVGLGLSNWDQLATVVGRVGATGRLTGIDFDNLTKAGFKLDTELRNTNITWEELFENLDRGINAEALAGQAETIQGGLIMLNTAFRDLGAAILGVKGGEFIEGGLGDRLVKLIGEIRDVLKNSELVAAFENFGKQLASLAETWIPRMLEAGTWLIENLNKITLAVKILFGTIATYVATQKIIGFFIALNALIMGNATVTGAANIAMLLYAKSTLAVEAALIRARTAVTAFGASVGIVAAAAVASIVLIIDATKKMEEAWDDAMEAEKKASDSMLELVNLNIERRKLARESESELVQKLAQADYEVAAAMARNETETVIAELVKRRAALREELRKDEEATKEWVRITKEARGDVNEEVEKTTVAIRTNIEATDEAAEAAKKAKQELESFQGRMISFIEEARKTKEALENDLAGAFESFADGMRGNIEETVQSMAQLVIGAEDSIEKLKEQLSSTDDEEQRSRLREQIKEQERILDAREGYEERQAERILAIRTKLEEAGIDAAEAGFDSLMNIRSLEEQIEEDRRIASLDEFSRFEEQQTRKMLVLADNLIAETAILREKIATQESYEADLTEYLKLQENQRLANTDAWAQETMAKYAEVADSLRGLLSLHQQVSNITQPTIPTPSLPAALQTTNTATQTTTTNNNVNMPVTINGHNMQNFSVEEINALLGFEYNKIQR